MAAQRVKSLTVEEMLQILENTDDDEQYQESPGSSQEIRGRDVVQVTIFPPEDGKETDEDSDDENTRNLNHFTPAQLVSECEVIGEVRETEATRHGHTECNKTSRNRKKERQWKNNIELPKLTVLEQDVPVNDTLGDVMTPTDCFEICFDESLVKILVDMSNRYAFQKNHGLKVTVSEMKVYLGILLLTRYLIPKNIRLLGDVLAQTRQKKRSFGESP
ncbi:piggyBac transposable element-derived protein 2-like [Portunus trituberculatus]|uniref:piggyBac transposable element-derived protein 2-like n=1 Tax=Portunus trituberculatus TaxID=210409 RepID=UPI001E1CCAF9|nr:piggyBac transposable element-derived protein 2-like [Portunus trituberculatus]